MLWAWIFRSLSMLVLVLGLLRPMVLSTVQGQARARLVVLVDRSASLAVSDREKPEDSSPTSRDQRLQRAWARALVSEPALDRNGISLDLRHFDEMLRSPPKSGLFADPPRGASTQLDRALATLQDEVQRDPSLAPITSVLVLSDAQVLPDDGARERIATHMQALDAPLSVVSGSGEHLRDLSLRTVGVPEFAFVENVTHFEVRLEGHGLSPRAVTVQLSKNGSVVDEQQVTVTAGYFAKNLRFRIAPDETGQFVYRFSVPDQGDEATLANNEARFLLRVLRDKVRVLHVAGRPDWDVRALRTLLKRDPNVELLSYYILRSQDDQLRDDPTAPMSLIGFPHRELFEEQLGSFDLIVLHNFDARTHADYIANFAHYVEQGGSLVLIGGDLGLATGDYNELPLKSILPAIPIPQAPLEGKFSVQLTPAGRTHPLSSWMKAAEARQPASIWPGLTQLNPAQASTAAELGTQTLLTARRAGESSASPLLTLSEPGQGRLLMLLTGQSWRLGFAEQLSLIDGLRPYDQLWRHVLRWALQQNPDQGLEVEIHPPHAKVEAPVVAKIRTLDPQGKSQPGVALQYRIEALDGPSAGQTPKPPVEIQSDDKGQVTVTLSPLESGAYLFRLRRNQRASADPKDEASKYVQRVFLVGKQAGELESLDARREQSQMLQLARQHGGDFWSAEQWPARLDELPRNELSSQPKLHALSTQARPLWHHGWIWLAMTGLLADWWIRRKNGYR